LSYIPAEGRPYLIAPERIIALALELGFEAAELLSPPQIAELLEQAFKNKTPLKAVSLCKPRDSVCMLEVSKDRLIARLTLKKARGRGKPLSLQAIAECIKKSGITEFSKEELRNEILTFFKDPHKSELIEYEIARGTLPGPGEDASLIFEVPFLRPEEKKHYLDLLQNSLQAKEINPSLKDFPLDKVLELALVKPEQKIATLIPPRKGKDGCDVYGKPIPGGNGQALELRLFENIKQYGHYLISTTCGILTYGRIGSAYALRVHCHRDASLSIELTDDQMQAYLTIIPHEGTGLPASEPQLARLLHEHNICYGLKQEAVQQALDSSLKGQAVEGLLIAEGTPPVNPEPPRLIIKIAQTPKPKVLITADGRADYKSASNLTLVKKGDLLAEIIPAKTQSRPGKDVCGRNIPPHAQRGSPLPNFYNVTQETAPDRIIKVLAACEGEFFNAGNAFGVRKLHVVKGDIGLDTGNIDFPGDVFIEGSIKAGFKVIAEGNIHVLNTVEAALLSAGGSITVEQGIKGRGKAILRAKENIECLFAEQATLLAVGDIVIKRSAMHCTIKCNGRLKVGQTKGSLIGGLARARCGMFLVNLGSVSETQTLISFGQDYLLLDQIEQLEKHLGKIRSRLAEIERTLQRAAVPDQAALKALREEKLTLLKQRELWGKKLITLRDSFDEHQPSEILVLQTVYPRVTIESHGRLLHIKEEKRAVSFTFNPQVGKIEEKSISFTVQKTTTKTSRKK